MKIRHLFLLLFAGLSAPLAAQTADPEWSRFANELKRKSRDIQTIECRFTQTRRAAVLKQEVSKQGTFSYKRPEQIRLLFADGDCIVMNGDRFRLVSGGKTTLVKTQSNPMLRELRRTLAACMTGDLDALTTAFAPRLTDRGGHYELRLVPRRKQRLAEMLLVISKRDMSLDALRMTETSGDYLHYAFTDKRFNGPIADETFRTEP